MQNTANLRRSMANTGVRLPLLAPPGLRMALHMASMDSSERLINTSTSVKVCSIYRALADGSGKPRTSLYHLTALSCLSCLPAASSAAGSAGAFGVLSGLDLAMLWRLSSEALVPTDWAEFYEPSSSGLFTSEALGSSGPLFSGSPGSLFPKSRGFRILAMV